MSSSADALRQSLVEIDDEIERWHAHLNLLQAKRTSILTSLDAVVYPVLTLPVEVTTEIFQHFTRSVAIGGSYTGKGPFILASVCRAWRAIALAIPMLWSNIYIQEADTLSREDSDNGLCSLLELCLSRAGQHLLSVDATYIAPESSLLPLLLNHSPRWEDFYYEISWPNPLPLDGLALPNLSTLWLTGPPNSFVEPFPERITAFSRAPALRKLQLCDIPFPNIEIPWAQLSSLILAGYPTQQCAEMLRQTSHLLELYLQYSFGDWNMPEDHVFVPSMTKLAVTGGSLASLAALAFLVVPGLKHLEVGITGSHPQEYELLSEFVLGSGCALESLSVRDVYMSAPGEAVLDLPGLLRRVPSVKKLCIDNMSWEALEQLLGAMKILPGLNVLLPNLEDFEISTHAPRVPYPDVADILQERRVGRRASDGEETSANEELYEAEFGGDVAQLHRFRLKISSTERWKDEENKQTLLRMAAEGRDIKLDTLKICEGQ
uniref:F-box domain-containing protein n=1 Tax=Mycena chlorophos TaxID=658473 RepID=A0ABQ0M5H4_MYCCL|nr:predicted protein [Mycena chlorophos]